MVKTNEKKCNSDLFLFIGMLFTACLIVSNITSFKVVQIGGAQLPAAVFLFVITYILNDVIAEVYGYEKAKRIIWTGFGLNLFVVLYFQFTIWLPATAGSTGADAYATVLGNTPRMLAASLAAYLAGSFLNAKIMVVMKKLNEKQLFARCITSTFFGELVDSIFFITIGFIGILPTSVVITMIITQAAFKTLYEVIAYPLTRSVIKKIKQIEGC